VGEKGARRRDWRKYRGGESGSREEGAWFMREEGETRREEIGRSM
jgi:hypothetical protein